MCRYLRLRLCLFLSSVPPTSCIQACYIICHPTRSTCILELGFGFGFCIDRRFGNFVATRAVAEPHSGAAHSFGCGTIKTRKRGENRIPLSLSPVTRSQGCHTQREVMLLAPMLDFLSASRIHFILHLILDRRTRLYSLPHWAPAWLHVPRIWQNISDSIFKVFAKKRNYLFEEYPILKEGRWYLI